MDHIVKCLLPLEDTQHIQVYYEENPFGEQWEGIWRGQKANGRETGNWQVMKEAIRGAAWKAHNKR